MTAMHVTYSVDNREIGRIEMEPLPGLLADRRQSPALTYELLEHPK
ncbi:hypothetical protein GCM10010520_32990 [Rhizobium viscosum]